MTANTALPASALGERYAILGELATGGMASVLYGRLEGAAGFTRSVAIKRLHPQFAREPGFVAMFIDEARICARLSHVNIVPTLDVIEVPSELCLVMEYVHGAALDTLLEVCRRRGEPVPVRVAVALITGVLHGLHAAHEACGDHGEPLGIVHRDVSPQNVLVGEDGVARLLDFGIAKATGKLRTTPSGEIKGKLAYMAPEQFRGEPVERSADIYGAATVLWEALVGRPMFDAPNESAIVYRVLNDEHPAPSSERADLPRELDDIVLCGLAREASERFATARAMALALERQVGCASQSEVSEWVRELAGDLLDARAAELRRLQQGAELEGKSLRPEERDAAATRASSGTRSMELAATRKLTSGPPPEGAPQQRGRRRALLVLLAVSCVALASALYLRGRGAPAAVTAGAPEEQAETQREAAPVATPPPRAAEPPSLRDAGLAPFATGTGAATHPEAPLVVELPGGSDAGEAQVDGGARAALPSRARTRPRRTRKRDEAAPEVVPPVANDRQCSPPYWWTAQGVKRFKPECL